jgi:hypothetical protein
MYEAHFDKKKSLELAKSLRDVIVKEGVDANLWSIEPHRVVFEVKTARSNMGPVLEKLYERSEVIAVSVGMEPANRLVFIKVELNESWYVEGKHVKARSRHPEAEGGSLA